MILIQRQEPSPMERRESKTPPPPSSPIPKSLFSVSKLDRFTRPSPVYHSQHPFSAQHPGQLAFPAPSAIQD